MGEIIDEKRQKDNGMVRVGIASVSNETVQRYGAAIKEHIVAYTGQDNENGIQLKKSLKSISEEQVNPDFQYQNLKQQAGFSAEVKETANINAQKIIQGDTSKKVRTDDLGRVNDPLFDHVEVDTSGKVIEGSGSQMKFVGASPEEAFGKLMSKKFEKYIENDAQIEVPADYYNGILEEADKRINKIQKQIEHQAANGNQEQVEILNKKLEKCKKIKKNLKESTLTTDEAMFARVHPELSTVKSITELSHRAGVEAAKYGLAVGGSVSIVRNLVALANGEENLEEAMWNVAKETASSGVVAYGTGFAGSVVKGTMQNAKSTYISSIAETSFPAMIVSTGIEVTNILRLYFNGEISGTQAVEQLGQKGVGTLAGSYGAAVGTLVFPVVGTVVGSMVGYMVSSLIYGSCLQILQAADLAQENYYATKEMCEAAQAAMRSQRMLFEAQSKQVLVHRKQVFDTALLSLMDEFESSDTTCFTEALSAIAHEFGRELQFKTEEEFERFMDRSDEAFVF